MQIEPLGLEKQPDNFLKNIPEIINKNKGEVMGISFNWLVKIIISVLSPVISIITPEIKTALETYIKDLYVKAKATENVWDDFLIKFIADILGVKVE